MLRKKKKENNYGEKVLLFLIVSCGILTPLFPLFNILLFSIILSFMLFEFKKIINWQTKKELCVTCKEKNNHD